MPESSPVVQSEGSLLLDTTPFLSPKSAKSPDSVESLPPWSDILLEELRAAIELNPPPGITRKLASSHTYRYRSRNRVSSKLLWLVVFILLVIWLIWRGSIRPAEVVSTQEGTTQRSFAGLQFIEANHPHIRYVGRWVAALDGLHQDGSFPGVYFDFTVNDTSTVLLALYNRNQQNPPIRGRSTTANLPFLPLANASHAAPISLLARVDDNEYIVLSNASSIVSIREGYLDSSKAHEIRIIAPMVGGKHVETLQVEGIWIDKKGKILPYESLSEDQTTVPERRKMLEIVTDFPGWATVKGSDNRLGATRAILGGVMGWEYLLGEMFGADHVMIGMDGMCLVEDCKGGRGSPAGLADVFFQRSTSSFHGSEFKLMSEPFSGPVGSEQFKQPWLFQQYIPDVMIINVGDSDWESFQAYNQEYNKTLWELSVIFEETYISMIKTIRTLAYPKYTGSSMDLSRYASAIQSVAGIPIFVMRPFRGQLEQATHSVVDRFQMDGDKNVFWLDTSGWLNAEIDPEGRAEDQDFFLDEDSPTKQWHLTERGSQRIAILLHMHVCRYLAHDAERCAFLPPEVYGGKAIDPEALRVEDYVQEEKERKLKKMFWD